MPTAARTYPYVELADQYALDVLAGKVSACRYVQLACERQRRDLAQYADPESAPFTFDAKAADRVCDIISRFPHIKGVWAQERQKLALEPWQCFILSTVFGWKSTATGRRRFKVAYIEVPRKNAKALALDTPVPTPDGWKTIGDIEAGDVILDGAGIPTEVLAISEVFTDHDCYRLDFSNGDSIIADAGHIWRTETRTDGLARDCSTEEIFETQGDGDHSLQLLPQDQTVEITAVEKTAPVPVKCLTVASPSGMFLCGRTMLPTHNSTVTSAVGNYMVACDGEAGAYVVLAANTRDQAKLVFVDSQIMARREEGFRSKFGVEVLAHVIAVPDTASKYEALSAEHSNLDGLNLHAALIDELHAHPTRGLWDVLETATGSRAQSLIWAITTAGVNRAGVCFDQRSHVIDILNGHIDDDSYFGIIYTVDDGDDPWDEETWAKANPNWGISIYPETIRSEAKRAQHMPSAQNAFFNKHLNIWTNADIAWLPAGSWDKCLDPKLDMEDFERQPCYLGLDLARRSDITAMMIVFPPSATRDWWAVFGRYYLPEQTVSRAEHSHYQGWETMGRLVSTPGVVTDFDYIIANLADIAARFDVQEIVFDPFDAGPAVNAIQKEGIKKPIVDVKQTAAIMSPAMVELEGLVLSKKIRHDGDPILAWMMANVRCRRTAGDLMQPEKENDSKKIDGVTATLMCIHRALRRDRPAAARVQILSMEDDE